MKFKIATMKEFEMEIENCASLAALDQWWKTHHMADLKDLSEDLVKNAIKEVEDATGLPFGYDDVSETITAVFTGNNTAILEF